MLDINFIRENVDLVKKGVGNKGFDITLVDKVLELDERRRKLLQDVENLNRDVNILSRTIKGTPTGEQIESGKLLKKNLQDKEPELDKAQEEYKEALNNIPNIPNERVPVGRGDKENVEVRRWGTPTTFTFEPRITWHLVKPWGYSTLRQGQK
jgi:seryl-tRNA synthetase